MKLADIVKVVANELGTSDLKEINKLLKDKPEVKFRITGKALKLSGFTGQIKSLSEEGVKAFMTNKVSLIRLQEIDTFEKKTRSEWYVKPAQAKPSEKTTEKKAAKNTKPPAKLVRADDDDEDFDDDDIIDEEDLLPKTLKKKKEKVIGKQGSKFIPSPKKK